MTDTQNSSLKLPTKSELAKADFTNTELNNQLLQAAEEGQDDKVNELILAEADVNAVDEYGNTPLILAAQQGRVKVINVLINSPSILINKADNTGNTALMFAAEGGYITAVIALLKSTDIALDQVNDEGDTALDKADQNSYNGIVNALRRRGARLSDESKAGPNPELPDTKAMIFSIKDQEIKNSALSPTSTLLVTEPPKRPKRRGPGAKCCTLV